MIKKIVISFLLSEATNDDFYFTSYFFRVSESTSGVND